MQAHTESENTAQRLAQLRVMDPQGDPVRLGALWTERPIVLVFLRHFG